jgi:hypothetical protein
MSKVAIPCATPGCTGHVYDNPHSLPALLGYASAHIDCNVQDKKGTDTSNTKRVYLTCDNTVSGPHKNVYFI